MAKELTMLSFNDILLRISDVELLEGPYWLNDTIISFYFEYLENVKFPEANDLLFISPAVTQCVKLVKTDEIKDLLDPLGVNTKNIVFFALNNNDSDRAGGSHWSLLVYSKQEKSFFHLDSSHSNDVHFDSSHSNDEVAWEFVRHLLPYLSTQSPIDYVNKDCLQQSNGYDCGVHVLCNTERLAEYAYTHKEVGSCDMLVNINPFDKRKEILSIINNLIETNQCL